MAPERRRDPTPLVKRDVIALPYVIERKQLHHQMMHDASAAFEQRQAVMTRIDMQRYAQTGVRM